MSDLHSSQPNQLTIASNHIHPLATLVLPYAEKGIQAPCCLRIVSSFLDSLNVFYMNGYFAYMYICVPRVCLVPMEVIERIWFPGIGPTVSVLGTESGASAKAKVLLNTDLPLWLLLQILCFVWWQRWHSWCPKVKTSWANNVFY